RSAHHLLETGRRGGHRILARSQFAHHVIARSICFETEGLPGGKVCYNHRSSGDGCPSWIENCAEYLTDRCLSHQAQRGQANCHSKDYRRKKNFPHKTSPLSCLADPHVSRRRIVHSLLLVVALPLLIHNGA